MPRNDIMEISMSFRDYIMKGWKMKKLLTLTVLMAIALTQFGCYSCQTWHHMWGDGDVPQAAAHKFWFDKDCKVIEKEVAAAPAPKPQSPPPAKMDKPVTTECGDSYASVAYPCDGCQIVVLTKQMPANTTIDAQFTYTIVAKNVSDVPVGNVVVTEMTPNNLKVLGTSPKAKVEGNIITWTMPKLDAGQSVTLGVTASATGEDCAQTCALVKYDPLVCAAVQITKPSLKLEKVAPKEVLACEQIPVKLTVTNTGTGTAKNVVVTDTLPDGLVAANGQKKLVFNAGDLGAGQSKQFTAVLNAEDTGKYENKAVAESSDGLKAVASTTTMVTQPVLTIAKSGPERRYLGRSVSYDITVANKGDATATDVVLTDTVPSGVTDVVACCGGNVSADKVVWNIPALKAGETKKFTVSYKPTRVGTIRDTASVTAKCAEGVDASAQTQIAGIPAVLLEVIDIDDPVELGGTTTYVITATNQGSAVGTNIQITAELEANEQYVSSSGATLGTHDSGVIKFAPLARLAPKAQATWRVVVKAVEEGDVRFKVIMNTDQITRPVQETESTHLYE